MGHNPTFEENQNQHPYYEIRLKGHLEALWADWFEGLVITLEEDGNTLLSGFVADQAMLHGLLKKVRDLGLPLVSVCPIKSNLTPSYGTDEANRSDQKQHRE